MHCPPHRAAFSPTASCSGCHQLSTIQIISSARAQQTSSQGERDRMAKKEKQEEESGLGCQPNLGTDVLSGPLPWAPQPEGSFPLSTGRLLVGGMSPLAPVPRGGWLLETAQRGAWVGRETHPAPLGRTVQETLPSKSTSQPLSPAVACVEIRFSFCFPLGLRKQPDSKWPPATSCYLSEPCLHPQPPPVPRREACPEPGPPDRAETTAGDSRQGFGDTVPDCDSPWPVTTSPHANP